MRPKRVALIAADWPIYEQFCPNFTGMTDGLAELGIEHHLFSCRPTLDVAAVIDYRPDLVIYALLDMVKAARSRYDIRKALPNAKIVMWYGDYRDEETGQIQALMPEIDAMFISNNAQAEFYKRLWRVKECHYLPLGCSIKKGKILPEYSFPVVFIGGKITGARFLDRARAIIDYEDKIGLKVIDASAQRQTNLRAKILKSMPDIYTSAALSLDISHFTDVDGYTSNRFFIIPACGGLPLTKRFPGCEKLYPEDSRLYFDTFEESIELVKKYANRKTGEKIRARALEVAYNHTYKKRFEEMFKIIYG